MQGSRSLFQAGIKLPNAHTNSGIRKSRPFLNVWKTPSPSPSSSSLSSTTQTARASTSTISINMTSATTFYTFTPKDKKAQPYPLTQHSGKVILAVNTASKCGFTPQFAGLEALYKKISTKHPGQFEILAFPCNQFNSQDPGDNNAIQEFCQVNYGVSFTVLGKTEVNGPNAEPVYEWMKAEKPGLMGLKRIKWNFEKFLIGRDGQVVQRWGSITKPEGLEKDIVREIEKGAKAAKSEL